MALQTSPFGGPLSSPVSMNIPCTCTERYDLVAELLQRDRKEAARAEALKIDCEHVRIRAFVLIERSAPIATSRPS